jgi:hypothetical protein
LVAATLRQGGTLNAAGWDGSRTTPVHWLPLVDEAGEAIVPEAPLPLPFSTRQTCGPCHDYATVAGGFHFRPDTAALEMGRPAQPWFWVDTATGTQIPVSGHVWPRTWAPAQLGLTEWQCTQLWGRHFPGGGWGEPADELADPEARWEVSGRLEANCLACHGSSPRQDPSEWAKQISRENFRWAATAAAGLGEVGGMASRVRGSWRLVDGPNPDDHLYAVPPSVRYDSGQFDRKHRVLVEVSHRPPDRNCLFCHSVTPFHAERWQVDGDVHSRAGIQCADCHRNGLDHRTVRGYEGESGAPPESSCRGCHLGTAAAAPGNGGRFGAPRPEHRGLPPLHLEKLSCTACHSGLRPDWTPHRVRTARANRLGIHGRAQWFTDAPQIVEPVFLEGPDGRIAPHRLAWPAFWARLEGARVTPLRPEAVAPAGRGILDARQQVAGVLLALRADTEAPGPAVLVMEGMVYGPTADQRVEAEPLPEGSRTGCWWARQTPDGLVPLVPEFDPAADLDPAVSVRLLATLQSLSLWPEAPGEPALVVGQTCYALANGAVRTTTFEAAPALSGWVWQKEGGLLPLLPEFVLAAVVSTTGRPEALTEDQVARVLGALATPEPAPGVSFGYVSSGKLFRLAGEGKLEAVDHETAAPCSWPLAHDVRPAVQALGSGGCGDCHSAEAPLLFGKVTATGPLITSRQAVSRMADWHGLQVPFHRLFAWTFVARPLFKVALAAAAVGMAVVVLAFVLPGVRRAAGFFSRKG